MTETEMASDKIGPNGAKIPGVSRFRPLVGAAEAPMGAVDPSSLLLGLAGAVASSAKSPKEAAKVGVRFGLRSAQAVLAAGSRAIGIDREGPARPTKGDRRFEDRAYEENPLYFLLAQEHLLASEALDELIDVAKVSAETTAKAKFAGQFLADALAPTNTLLGNPTAVRRAFDTGGKSVVRGARNMAGDVVRNGGWPSQVDTSGFELGRNMAATPGKVVHRGELIEVLQYEPQTEQVHELPLVFCPPWINKYYIMDLAPGRSLIEWAVNHGHSSFAISYRNPDASMRDLGFTDYLHRGFLEALEVVSEIAGVPKVNTVSVCLGGTLTAIGLAYCAQVGKDLVNASTFLNTHTDFSEPGTLGVFTDERSVRSLERRMNKKGYLDAKEMAHTFDALRANELIFSYVSSNWLLGDKPPAFDLLAWNGDSTRMPARMHSQYLRSCYLENQFSRGEFEVDGYKLDPAAVDTENYVLGAVADHIVPWTSAHKTSRLLGGRNRFVLSSSGHIAGIVNPPSPKARYWTNDDAGSAEAEEWLEGAQQHQETWWEDWARWIGERAGGMRDRPTDLGSGGHPPVGDAPGTYVTNA